MTPEQRLARNIFAESCFGKTDKFHGGNCVHCCLRGIGKPNTADGKGTEPNYAGWQRLYVQDGRAIPAQFRKAFLDSLRWGENAPFVEALWQDIYLYGLTLEI